MLVNVHGLLQSTREKPFTLVLGHVEPASRVRVVRYLPTQAQCGLVKAETSFQGDLGCEHKLL